MASYRIKSWPGFPSPLVGNNQPDLRPITTKKYLLKEDYPVVVIDNSGTEYVLTVPGGFVGDGASIPRLVWTISGLRPDGIIRAAALVHDFIYRGKGKVLLKKLAAQVLGSRSYVIPRTSADLIFYDLMQVAGMVSFRSKLAYNSVRLFGWSSW